MREKLSQWFLHSVAVALFLTAAAKLYSITGSAKILRTEDPLIHLTYRNLMFLAAFLETTIAVYLLAYRNLFWRAAALIWLSGNFMLYRLWAWLAGVSMCPCLGTLTERLPLSKAQVNSALSFLVLYMFLGGGWILVELYPKAETSVAASRNSAGSTKDEERNV